MDPNANLAEQRRLRERLDQGLDEPEATEALERLKELTEALDDWLSGGGFLPEAWKR